MSPNFNRDELATFPRAVMIHSTRSTREDFTDEQELGSTINTFKSSASGVSAHWIVSAKERVRVVRDRDKAWHAGFHNRSAMGIEVTQPTADRPYQDGHYRNLVLVCADYVEMGTPIVFLPNFTNGALGFTGHEDSLQGRGQGKSDPGEQFDWIRFLNELRNASAPDGPGDIVIAGTEDNMICLWDKDKKRGFLLAGARLTWITAQADFDELKKVLPLAVVGNGTIKKLNQPLDVDTELPND